MSETENKVRRSKRISRELPILLIGSDAEGRVFTEETHTVMLSQHGAGIASKHKLLADQKFVMVFQQQAAKREVAVRVVGEIAEQGKTHIYGVAFLDKSMEFWEEELPEAAPWDERPEVLVLECSRCKGVVQIASTPLLRPLIPPADPPARSARLLPPPLPFALPSTRPRSGPA